MYDRDACKLEPIPVAQTFEELEELWSTDKHWLRFFVRPCCPAPGGEAAVKMIERLKDDIAAGDFSDEQKQRLAAIADERIEWYLHLGVRKGK